MAMHPSKRILQNQEVIEWLLDSDPSIRWQVMRDLTGAPSNEVAGERTRVATEGFGARLLALQGADGRWGGFGHQPTRAVAERSPRPCTSTTPGATLVPPRSSVVALQSPQSGTAGTVADSPLKAHVGPVDLRQTQLDQRPCGARQRGDRLSTRVNRQPRSAFDGLQKSLLPAGNRAPSPTVSRYPTPNPSLQRTTPGRSPGCCR